MTRFRARLSLVVLLAACGAPAPTPPDLAAARAELMAADRAFDSTVAAAGVAGGAAWGAFFGDSGKQVPPTGPYTAGRAATAARMAGFFGDSTNRLRWSPEYAEVSGDATLGYTIGAYRALVVHGDSTAVAGTGRYLTVWRKQADGRWLVAADIGNEANP